MPTVKELIQGAVAGLLIEKPGAKRTLPEWISQLENDGKTIEARVNRAKNEQKAQIVLRHITGIERWGQQRLQVFLGKAFVRDEFDGYQPATNLSTQQQVAEFNKTRAETIAIVRKIAAANLNSNKTVEHNQIGQLTLRGWLRYLDIHANLESKKIR